MYNYLFFLLFIGFVFILGCKTTDEKSSLYLKKDLDDVSQQLWKNGIDLNFANLDLLYELYKNKGYTREMWEDAKYKGMR